uniref:Serine-rich protein-like protein n=1 Tax=Picea sitchensis TaxID=3332 RepID=A9P044_PICSI|nr:unknown [Picea sitchensis]
MEARIRSSSAPVMPLTFGFSRSNSPTRHLYSPSSSSSAFNFAVHRTLSPTRAACGGASSYRSSASAAASASTNFALDRSASQVRSARRPITPKGDAPMKSVPSAPPRQTCMCSPTNHPGSFRCSLHRNSSHSSSTHSQLNARRSAMTNSLVRIGGVEGEWVRRALTSLIRPSSHHMRRRSSFQRRPSRLCHMTTAQDVS